MASSKTVFPIDVDDEQQPEMAMRSPKPEILIPWINESIETSAADLRVYDHVELEESIDKWLRQRPTTGNSSVGENG